MNHRQLCPRHPAPPVSQLEDGPGALSLELLTVGHAACHGTARGTTGAMLPRWLRDRDKVSACAVASPRQGHMGSDDEQVPEVAWSLGFTLHHRTSALASLLANVNIKIAGLDVHHFAVDVVQ